MTLGWEIDTDGCVLDPSACRSSFFLSRPSTTPVPPANCQPPRYKSLSSVPWSERLAERYRCCFSPVLVDWFDSDIWKRKGCGEYSSPVEPALLLSDAPEQVWPGLMSCDLIPLVESTAGDWLCVRVDENSMASEVVQWYHGGGDWIPWGQDIAQAIVFDGYLPDFFGWAAHTGVPPWEW